ncbi:hypothetical protein B0H14DRAFT_2572258 [Mycena olivaceomarginata]|nr:hypothetical protein B0H14DRAFT_2572258 [Mycena olivaceomarginata]
MRLPVGCGPRIRGEDGPGLNYETSGGDESEMKVVAVIDPSRQQPTVNPGSSDYDRRDSGSTNVSPKKAPDPHTPLRVENLIRHHGERWPANVPSGLRVQLAVDGPRDDATPSTEERHAAPRGEVDRTSQSQNWDTGDSRIGRDGQSSPDLADQSHLYQLLRWISTNRISPSKYGRGLALQNRARHGTVTVRYGAVFRGPRLRCPALDKTGEFAAGVFRISLGDSVGNRDPLMIRVKMVRYESKRTLDGPGFNVQCGHREIEDLIVKMNKYTKYTALWLWENGFLGRRRTGWVQWDSWESDAWTPCVACSHRRHLRACRINPREDT